MHRSIRFSLFTSLIMFVAVGSLQAQTSPEQPTPIENQRDIKKKPTDTPKTAREKEVEESLERAAEAAANAAEKLKVVIEDKADKIAKSSKPYIENFLIATSNLIEKLSIEIEKAVEEKPVKREKQK